MIWNRFKSRRPRKSSRLKVSNKFFRPVAELLESRLLLSNCTISWSIDADGFWDDPNNWQDNTTGAHRLPSAADDVCIDRPGGDFTVTHRQGSDSIRSLHSQEAIVLSAAP